MNERSFILKKRDLILEVARKTIVKYGFHDASISKIAKEAQIPVGSIYTYFKSKEELINAIYTDFKIGMGQYIFSAVPENLTEREELGIYWSRAVSYGLAHEEQFFFAEQFVHSGMLLPTSAEEIKVQFASVFSLLERGIKNDILKDMNLFLMHNLIYTNIVGTIKFLAFNKITIDNTILDMLFVCCWDSIKK